MNVVCKYGLSHDKEVVNGEPSSNNGWIYTAIRDALRMSIYRELIFETFKKCVVKIDKKVILIDRLPGKKEPPLSHDEIMGIYLLGFIHFEILNGNNFVYHGEGKKISLSMIFWFFIGVFKLYLIGKKEGEFHRNHFWQFEVKEIYPIAFRLGPHYTYFLKVDNGIRPNFIERIAWKTHCDEVVKNGSNSSKNILFAMAMRLKDLSLIERINPRESIPSYFGDNHPFTEFLNANKKWHFLSVKLS